MSRRFTYLLLFVAFLVVAIAIPLWRELDWSAYRLLMGRDLPVLADDIVLIDLPYQKDDQELFRNHQGQLLRFLAGQGNDMPRVVVLDIAFTEENRGAAALCQSIDTLTKMQIPVYATYDPQHANEQIYAHLSGKGHTVFQVNSGTFFYNTVLSAKDTRFFSNTEAPSGEEVDALPEVVAVDPKKRMQGSHPPQRIVYVGSSEEIRSHTLRFEPGSSGGRLVIPPQGYTAPSLRVRNKIIIVGSMERDRPQAALGRSGPELLAWAINDLIASRESYKPVTIRTNPKVLTAMVFSFAGLTAGLFAVLFRLFPRWHNKLWLICGIAAGIGLIVLTGLVVAQRVTDNASPQVTLVVLAIIMSAGMSWHYFAKLLARRAFESDLIVRPDDDRNEYDIFISYSHTPENIAWVEHNLYEPLSRIKKADGTPLRIFFDKSSIKVGSSWYQDIARSIEGSHVFIPVYTSDYFDRDFCRFEMERAAIKHVTHHNFILPIMQKMMDEVPVEYNHIQYIDVSEFPDFIHQLASKMPDTLLA